MFDELMSLMNKWDDTVRDSGGHYLEVSFYGDQSGVFYKYGINGPVACVFLSIAEAIEWLKEELNA